MEAFDQYMFLYLFFDFYFLFDSQGDQFDQLEYFYFGRPLLDYHRYRLSIIQLTTEGIERLAEGILFGNVDMQFLVIMKQIAKNDFCSIDYLEGTVDRFQVLELFI